MAAAIDAPRSRRRREKNVGRRQKRKEPVEGEIFAPPYGGYIADDAQWRTSIYGRVRWRRNKSNTDLAQKGFEGTGTLMPRGVGRKLGARRNLGSPRNAGKEMTIFSPSSFHGCGKFFPGPRRRNISGTARRGGLYPVRERFVGLSKKGAVVGLQN